MNNHSEIFSNFSSHKEVFQVFSRIMRAPQYFQGKRILLVFDRGSIVIQHSL
jgi:hypothetical protein